MTCKDCSAAKETQGQWRQYDSLKCIYCAARLIQKIGKLEIPNAEITARRRAVLADAVAWGHSEAAIRELVKGPMALAPMGNKK